MQHNDFGYRYFFLSKWHTLFIHSFFTTNGCFRENGTCTFNQTGFVTSSAFLSDSYPDTDSELGDKEQRNGSSEYLLIKFKLPFKRFICLNVAKSKVISTHQPGHFSQFGLLDVCFPKVISMKLFPSGPPHSPPLCSTFANFGLNMKWFWLKSMNATISPWLLNFRSAWINH